MPNLLAQTARVAIVAACCAVATVLVRGSPTLAHVEHAPGTCSAPVPSRPGVRWITQDEGRHLVDDPAVTFVDARDTDEFEQGHIAGAISVPMDRGTVTPAVVAMLRNARTVITYCDTTSGCARSSRLANLLAMNGLVDVRVLEGGMPGWLARSYPAEAGSCRNCP